MLVMSPLSVTVELHLFGLIGRANHSDMQKIRIIGFFFENRLHWQFEGEIISTNRCFWLHIYLRGAWGGVVFKALRYWSRDRFPVVSLDFSVTYSFRPYHGTGVDSAPSENEYQEHFLGWRRPVRETDNLATFMCRMSWKSGRLNLLEPSGPHRACYGTALPFYLFFVQIKQ